MPLLRKDGRTGADDDIVGMKNKYFPQSCKAHKFFFVDFVALWEIYMV